MCLKVRAEGDPLQALEETSGKMQGRRRFIRSMISGLGMVGLALLKVPSLAWAHPKRVSMPLPEALKSVDSSMLVEIKGQTVLLVRDSLRSVRAIHPVCTHQKCPVTYRSDIHGLYCKCHKSEFKLDGSVVKGPASKPLTVYPTAMQDNLVILTLSS